VFLKLDCLVVLFAHRKRYAWRKDEENTNKGEEVEHIYFVI